MQLLEFDAVGVIERLQGIGKQILLHFYRIEGDLQLFFGGVTNQLFQENIFGLNGFEGAFAGAAHVGERNIGALPVGFIYQALFVLRPRIFQLFFLPDNVLVQNSKLFLR